MREDPLIAFARDFSDNAEAIVAQVQAYLATPPVDEEVIGFYGSEHYAPRTRAYLATVSLLEREQFLDAAEDKYTIDLLRQWQKRGVIDVDTLPPAALAVFGPLLRPAAFAADPAMDSIERYAQACWNAYAAATQELEQHIAARGKVLLSVDATDGDTLFFATCPRDVAARWQGKALAEEGGYRAGVRSPMWDRFWDHLMYHCDPQDESVPEGYPPGTRVRENRLPFAE